MFTPYVLSYSTAMNCFLDQASEIWRNLGDQRFEVVSEKDVTWQLVESSILSRPTINKL